jgi:hypothetical protein
VSVVNVIIEHRAGNELRKTHLRDIHRQDAENFVKSIGALRHTDGMLTITTPSGMSGAIPARNVEFVEVTES